MRSMRLVTLVLVVTFLASAPAAFAQQKQPTAIGSGGAAATVDLLGTRAAIDTLEDGGNAVDAAVAAAAVLGVTEPYSCGIGGGGFMVIRTPEGEVTTIDSREESPAAMRPDSFFENGAPLPFNDARYSGLSAGVPGTVAGWDRALREYGTQSLRRGAGRGDRHRPRRLHRRPDLRRPDRRRTSTSSTTFPPRPSSTSIQTAPPRDVGTVLRNPDLARTYERIAKLGTKGFYRGAVADAMVEAVQDPPIAASANHTWRPGLMTMRDVRRYAAIEREPTHIGYRGLDVWGMGPPSSGGSTVGEALNILEGYDLSPTDPPTFDERVRRCTSSSSPRASRSRTATPGSRTPTSSTFRSRDCSPMSYAAERRALIDPDPPRPTQPSCRPGDPRPLLVDHAPRGVGRRGAPSSPTRSRSSRQAATASSCRSWGFLLNNELTDFNFSSLTAPEPGRRRQAPAQLDEPDDRDRRRRAVPRGRLPGRLDDHHDRRCRCCSSGSTSARRCRRRSRRRGRASATPPPRWPSRRSSRHPRVRRSTRPVRPRRSRCPARSVP